MPRLRPLIVGLFAVACLSIVPPAFAKKGQAITGSMDVTIMDTDKDAVPGQESHDEFLGGGLGSATVLGDFTPELDYEINFGSNGQPTTFHGQIIFHTAAGDLHGEISGHYTSATDFVGAIDFIGGTGPYRHASGEVEVTSTPPTQNFLLFHATFTGTLKLKKAGDKGDEGDDEDN